MGLVSDCSRCIGLCCAAPPFRRSADFAFERPADTPCRNLGASYGCGIHGSLRADGMVGCTDFECFGAGQHVSHVTYGGVSWRDDPATTSETFAVFLRVRDRIAGLAGSEPEAVLAADPFALRDEVGPVLDAVSREARGAGPDHRYADLSGADLRTRDLRRANLRGADVSGALFLAQPQVNAARGSVWSVLPDRLARPAHWSERA